jgi:hypothetical protein
MWQPRRLTTLRSPWSVTGKDLLFLIFHCRYAQDDIKNNNNNVPCMLVQCVLHYLTFKICIISFLWNANFKVSGDEGPRHMYSTTVRFWADARDFSTATRPVHPASYSGGTGGYLVGGGGVKRTAASRAEAKYSVHNTFTTPYTFMTWCLIKEWRLYVKNERTIPTFSPLKHGGNYMYCLL